MQTDEVGQGMDRRQALIARGWSAAAPLFQIAQEGPNPLGREVFHPELVDPSAGLACGEGQELLQRVAVALLRVAGEVSFADEVLQQETPDPGTQKDDQS